MTRMWPKPSCFVSFASARNFCTIGRAWPGLQYMMSRTRNIPPPHRLFRPRFLLVHALRRVDRLERCWTLCPETRSGSVTPLGSSCAINENAAQAGSNPRSGTWHGPAEQLGQGDGIDLAAGISVPESARSSDRLLVTAARANLDNRSNRLIAAPSGVAYARLTYLEGTHAVVPGCAAVGPCRTAVG